MKTLEDIKGASKTKMKMPELLAPAGNLEKLKLQYITVQMQYF